LEDEEFLKISILISKEILKLIENLGYMKPYIDMRNTTGKIIVNSIQKFGKRRYRKIK